MRIWPKRYAAAKVLALGLLCLAVDAQRNICSLSPRRVSEMVLKYELAEMRNAIDQYTLEREAAPESLEDLVEANYLLALPVDPLTKRRDWVERKSSPGDSSRAGLTDIHSAYSQMSTEGTRYDTW